MRRRRSQSRGNNCRDWFLDDFRSFRAALLRRRDGARLHAGSHPGTIERTRIEAKIAYVVATGFKEPDACMAMLAAGRHTIGCVLEEQAEASYEAVRAVSSNHDAAFAAGLTLIVRGFGDRIYRGVAS